MKLSYLLARISTSFETTAKDVAHQEVADIAIDSRLVKEGSVFFSLAPDRKAEQQFIHEAFKRGAIAVVAKPELVEPDLNFIQTSDPWSLLVEVAQKFYHPLPDNVYAVTGTNGKTSTVEFTRQILELLGHKSASIGSIGVICDHLSSDQFTQSGLTTSDIVSFYKNLHTLKQNGINDVAVETSSIGLIQKRMDGIKFAAGAFTNFSQDHLDYHQSMEEYFKAKILLFENVLKKGAAAVLNSDIAEYAALKKICEAKSLRILSYGFKAADPELKITKTTKTELGQKINFRFKKEAYEANLALSADFQIYNVICALAIVLATHEISTSELKKLFTNFPKLKAASGRMEQIKVLKNSARIFVDYANTPNASLNALTVARKFLAGSDGKLIILFGCGGNRDTKKRPIMGGIATKHADAVIITDDNPRNEDPALIRKDIIAGCGDLKKVKEIAGRAQAIEYAIKSLGPNDILILQGKGHEKYQIIGDRKNEFDETKIVTEITNQLKI